MDQGLLAMAALTALTEINMEGICISDMAGERESRAIREAAGLENAAEADYIVLGAPPGMGASVAMLGSDFVNGEHALDESHLMEGYSRARPGGHPGAQRPRLTSVSRILMREASVAELDTVLHLLPSLTDFYLEQLDITDSVLSMDGLVAGSLNACPTASYGPDWSSFYNLPAPAVQCCKRWPPVKANLPS
eukprot:gene27914-12028_t